MAMTGMFKAYLQKQQDYLYKNHTTIALPAPGGGGIGSAPPASYEHRGGKPTDAESPLNTVQTAVKRMVQAERHRSLLAAIDTLHSKRQSNGKPVVYLPE